MAYIRPAIARIMKKAKKIEAQAGAAAAKYPPYLYTLFYAFSLYLVLPLIDVPLLGLSISAPLFFIIAATVFFRPVKQWFNDYRGLIILSLIIWLAVAFSTIINEMLPGASFNRSGMISIVQYAYWLLTFVVCAYLFNDQLVQKKVVNFFAYGILILSILRWVEAVVFDRIGAWSNTQFMSQNGYGFQFSIFFPFLIYKVFDPKTNRKGWWVVGVVVALGAIAINGSRGSWVSVALGMLLLLVAFFIMQPKTAVKGFLVLFIVTTIGALVLVVSPRLNSAVISRFETLQSLDEDKSYVVRKVLVQKGLKLFAESPVIGVGSLRFTQEKTSLELPDILSEASLEYIERKESHNSYIQFLAEFGLLGSIPFVLLIFSLLINSLIKVQKTMKSGSYLPIVITISFIQMLTHMWVINALTSTLFWAILGLNAGMSKEENN